MRIGGRHLEDKEQPKRMEQRRPRNCVVVKEKDITSLQKQSKDMFNKK